MPPELVALAAQQRGVVLRRQALAARLTDDDIARLVRRGMWTAIRRGAYVETAHWACLDAAQQHMSRAHAVSGVLTCPTVLSHTTAALLHELDVWGVSLDDVHVTRRLGSSPRREAGVHHHVADLPQHHVVRRSGLTVTSKARTVVDVARLAGIEPGLVVADSALRLGLDNTELRDVARAAADWPGARAAGFVAAFADGRSETVGESRCRLALARAGLPAPDLQVTLHLPGWPTAVRVDFLIKQYATVIEFDGRGKYGETEAAATAALWREKQREDALRDAGYEVVRLVWGDLTQPHLVREKVTRAFARAAGRSSLELRGREARHVTLLEHRTSAG